MKQAVILAGGKGTRLASVLNGAPKPLVEVLGTPLLERQIRALMNYGFDDFVILVNHAADAIASFFKVHSDFCVKITLIDDGVPRGTAGAVLSCLDGLADHFLVVYGDTYFDIDVTRFVAHHNATGAAATLFLHPNDHPQDSDLVESNSEGRVVAFHPYPHPAGALLPNLVNAAFYAVDKSALESFRDFKTPSDFGKDLFPAMIAAGAKLSAYRSFEYIKDLGTPPRLAKVSAAITAGVPARANLTTKQKVVFVDRDGTLNVKRGFIRTAEEFDLIPGAAEAIKRLNDHEYRVVVITNQPVIARGETTLAELQRIHYKLDTLLGLHGAFIDGLYFCPHHPDSGFPGEVKALKFDCDCRKPKQGMIVQASEDLNADIERSWFIGDTTLDIETAKRANLCSILVKTGDAGLDGKFAAKPTYECVDISAAVDLIVGSG